MLSDLEQLVQRGKVELEYRSLFPDTEPVFMLTWREYEDPCRNRMPLGVRWVYTREMAEQSVVEGIATNNLVRKILYAIRTRNTT